MSRSIEALASELGTVAARVERDLRAQFDVLASDMRAKMAEMELRAVTAERTIAELVANRMSEVKAGVAATVSKAVAAIPPAAPGRDADPELVRQMVADAVAEIPPAQPGKDADPAVVAEMVRDAVAAIPPAPAGERGPPGRLPAVKAWTDAVHYDGDVVTLDGSTYQALRDTGRMPPHEDWACLAMAGRDGAQGRSFVVRGTWAQADDYAELDVVVTNGAAFVATSDHPGACPGEGWQMISAQGKKGKPGDDGRKGDPGPPGPAVIGASVDDMGMLTLRNANGTTVSCDFYPVLSRIDR